MRNPRDAASGNHMYPLAGREIFVRVPGNCDGIPAVQLDNNFQTVPARHPFLDRRAGNTSRYDTQNRSNRAPLPPPIVMPATPPTAPPATVPIEVLVPSICTGRTLSTVPYLTACSCRAAVENETCREQV
jgi:hypothetical protein